VLEVSRSGFYDYQARQATPKINAEEVVLLARVKEIALATRSSYGSRRMAKALQADGFAVGRVKARRLMKEAGVRVERAKRVEVRQLLAEVYNWFTEGFDTADLQEAKALLGELAEGER